MSLARLDKLPYKLARCLEPTVARACLVEFDGTDLQLHHRVSREFCIGLRPGMEIVANGGVPSDILKRKVAGFNQAAFKAAVAWPCCLTDRNQYLHLVAFVIVAHFPVVAAILAVVLVSGCVVAPWSLCCGCYVGGCLSWRCY